MNSESSDGEGYYFGEVIGSSQSYHRPECHIVRLIQRRNRKLLRNWEEAVLLGLNPCPHCRPPYVASMLGTIDQPASVKDRDVTPDESEVKPASNLSASALNDIRREVLRILDQVDDSKSRLSGESVGARIVRLLHANVIPRKIAAYMKTITETRNAAEYESDEPSETESDLVRLSLIAIREWASDKSM